VGFDVLTTCQPSTVWCSRERLPAAAAQPAKVRQNCSATEFYLFFKSRELIIHQNKEDIKDNRIIINVSLEIKRKSHVSMTLLQTARRCLIICSQL
jgi:predicted metal-binding transcription factor (methanogenesis marker protein 9)